MMRPKCRSPLHAAISTSYKEYLETKLALALLENPALLPAAHKISMILLDILQTSKVKIINEMFDECVLRELYGSDYFGRLQAKDSVYDDILQILKNPNAAFESVMHVHCVVLYRIVPKILRVPKAADKRNECTRTLKTGECIRSDNWGIARNKCFSHMFKTKTLPHLRAIDKFDPNPESAYVKEINEAWMPYVAGPSGHTRSLMGTAAFLGLTDTEALKEYALACFAFLAAGGNHCFHEVMLIAKEYGVPYVSGDYLSALPETVKGCQDLKTLVGEFVDVTQTCCYQAVSMKWCA